MSEEQSDTLHNICMSCFYNELNEIYVGLPPLS